MLGARFESLEDERSVSAGTALLDFTSRSGERFDQLLTRFDLVRHEAEMVGAGIINYHTISTILLRAVGLSPEQMVNLLQRYNGLMPNTQAQYDDMVRHLRTMGHILANV